MTVLQFFLSISISEQFTESVLVLQITLPVSIVITISILVLQLVYQVQILSLDQCQFFLLYQVHMTIHCFWINFFFKYMIDNNVKTD